jgi:hypothetical protein
MFAIGSAIGIEVVNLKDETPLKDLTAFSYSLRDSIRDSNSTNPRYPVYIHHKKQNKDVHFIKVSSINAPFEQGTLLPEGEYQVSLIFKKTKKISLIETITVKSSHNYFEISQSGIRNVL